MKSEMRDYKREELLELSASRYLSEGFVDKRGKPFAELQTTFATAAATQFLDAQLSPQELAYTYEALKQVLTLHAGTPSAQILGAIAEALEVVRAMVKQPNNARLKQWLAECAAAVKTDKDINAFLEHYMAVLRQYTVIVASVSR
jgi:hypothetical protein